jgi:putative heme iron utilization protein
MAPSHRASEPAGSIEELIKGIFDSQDVVFTITSGDNLSIAELMGQDAPVFQGGWWSVETPGWHIHAQLSAIRRVRFVREPSDGEESMSIHFVGPNSEALLGCYFTHLYDQQKRSIAARYARWEALRQQCGGQDEVEVENGAIARC